MLVSSAGNKQRVIFEKKFLTRIEIRCKQQTSTGVSKYSWFSNLQNLFSFSFSIDQTEELSNYVP